MTPDHQEGRPLAIDLFCGLTQAEFRGRHEAFVKQPMACRAENPKHVRAAVLHLPPYALSPMFRSVSQFNDSRLSAGLAGIRQIWKFPPHPSDHSGVFELSTGVVHLLRAWVFAMKGATLFSRGLPGAVIGAIAAIAIGPNDREVLGADSAQLSVFGFVGLLPSPQAARARCASDRTEPFVWAFCDKTRAAA